MSVESSNVQSRDAVVLPEESHGVYSSLFSKINLSPVSELGDIDMFQCTEALSEASADERVNAAFAGALVELVAGEGLHGRLR